MHRMDRRAVFALVLFLALSFGGQRFAAAQNQTPNPSDEHLDIGAMNLTTGDMPEGFRLSIENYVAGQGVAESLYSDPDQISALMDTGLIVVYSSEYQNAAGDLTIRSYIQ